MKRKPSPKKEVQPICLFSCYFGNTTVFCTQLANRQFFVAINPDCSSNYKQGETFYSLHEAKEYFSLLCFQMVRDIPADGQEAKPLPINIETYLIDGLVRGGFPDFDSAQEFIATDAVSEEFGRITNLATWFLKYRCEVAP